MSFGSNQISTLPFCAFAWAQAGHRVSDWTVEYGVYSLGLSKYLTIPQKFCSEFSRQGVSWRMSLPREDTPEMKATVARTRLSLIERLGELDLDVIALQEVTPGMLAALCRAPWVRASYALTDVPPGTSLAPQGQLVLSRVPMVRAGLHTCRSLR